MMISAADRGSFMRVRLGLGDRPATGRSRPPGGRSLVGARGFEPPTSRSRTVRATRLRYAPTRPAYCSRFANAGSGCRSHLPGVLPDELDELALAALARPHLSTNLLDQGEDLVRGVSDRHHHPPALGELLEERRRHGGAAGGDQDPVERRLVGPAERPAADADPHVRVAELLEERARTFGEARQPLDRAHAARELGEHRRLVAGAGADLERLLTPGELEELRHERDDVGLGDGLFLADRERVVAVRAPAERLLHEEVARHLTHRAEHAHVGDPAALELLLHHLRAHERERIPHARHYSLRARFRAVGRYWASRLRPKSASASSARWLVRSRWSGVIET